MSAIDCLFEHEKEKQKKYPFEITNRREYLNAAFNDRCPHCELLYVHSSDRLLFKGNVELDKRIRIYLNDALGCFGLAGASPDDVYIKMPIPYHGDFFIHIRRIRSEYSF